MPEHDTQEAGTSRRRLRLVDGASSPEFVLAVCDQLSRGEHRADPEVQAGEPDRNTGVDYRACSPDPVNATLVTQA
ncbi:hypothetical protein CVV72_24860 [Amycolatopsis sp. TNS106]|nr:hypothetical protein CVV72_24860 [Amycolatopsis sp. TNS106]